MKASDFDYELPPALIAQEPARPRGASRLLVLDRTRQTIAHRRFRDLPQYLTPDDVVVLNDTRVVRARLRGRRPGGGRAEVLLLEPRADGLWEALVSPGRRLPPGRSVVFGEGELEAEIVARTPTGGRLLRFRGEGDVAALVAQQGELPLPPYIQGPLHSESDYQTVYAREPGSSAAPTAGLHFTPEVLDAVRGRVRALVTLTLHIGPGTFRPIRTQRVEDHDMHSESYLIPQQTADAVSRALAEGRRVVAVGTSTARALEAAAEGGQVRPGAGRTDLFIRPGYRFGVVGALVTNFHLPRSTVLVLVCAFAGREAVLGAYQEAIARRYRFLSFGDSMLIL